MEDSCQERRDVFSTSKVYPMAGAILGTCLGGPVGFLAGVKIGGLAAVGGSIFGRIFYICNYCYFLSNYVLTCITQITSD